MLDYNKITANINDINGNYWIKANAGCGKTTKLVGRFLFLLKNGIKPEDIVCITYTNAGAKEMKDRVINELLTLQQCNKAQQVQNINYNSLQIDTIHGFCQKILIKQKILPENVKIISSNIHEKNRIVRQIIQSISNSKYLENDVYNITKSISYDEFCQIINDVIEKQNNFRELCEEVFDTDIENNDIQNHKDLSFLLPEEIRHLKNINLQELTNHINDTIHKTDEYQIIKLFEYIKSRSKTRNTTANDVNIYDLNEWKNIVFQKDKSVPRQEPSNAKNPFDIKIINTFCEVQNYFITKQNKLSFDSTMALLKIAKHILYEYEKIKKQLNVITYDDILFETKKIAKKGSLPPIKYLILDEAQDTNPISWDIISHFKQTNGDNSIIFVVGDEKQSIYSFQGANLDYYDKYYHFFKNRTQQDNKQNWHDEVILDTSYRSKKEILKQADELCNKNIDAFCNNTPIGYTIKHKTAVDGKGVVVYKQLSFDNNDEAKQEKVSDKKYSWVERLKEKIEKQNNLIQIAKNIAVELFKISKNGKTTAIIVAKKNTKNEIAFDIVGELQKFTNVNFLPELATKQIYFQDLLAIIKFVILQNDDLNLACLLKSELFGFTDDDLMSIRNKNKELLFDNLLSHSWQEKSKKAVLFLKTIISKYTITDIIKDISLFIENNTLCCNVNSYEDVIKLLQDIHKQFLESGENDLNLRGFIDYVNGNNYKNKNIEIKEGIFFSTIHGVKGLEFDNVILLNLEEKEQSDKEKYLFFEKNNNDKNGTFLYKKNEIILDKNCKTMYNINKIKEKLQLEHKRLMYVAITRAKTGFYNFYLKNLY